MSWFNLSLQTVDEVRVEEVVQGDVVKEVMLIQAELPLEVEVEVEEEVDQHLKHSNHLVISRQRVLVMENPEKVEKVVAKMITTTTKHRVFQK